MSSHKIPIQDGEDSIAAADPFPIYVGGEFVSTGRLLNICNPYSGEVSFRTYLAGNDELETAITAAQAVAPTLHALSAFDRYQILQEISDSIYDQRDRLAVVMAREAGKPIRAGRLEAERAAQTFLVAAEEAKRLPRDYMSLDWTPSGAGKEALIKYFPVGLVAGIAPFNFPLNLVAHKMAPAIASGCPLVLKPATKTPISALLLAAIADRSTLPKGALSVLPMDREAGDSLVTDERFALLSFTGSPAVGWEMKKRCGKKKVVLELGGNAGLIVEGDTDLARVIERAIAGAFGNAGQSCIHTQRIYIQQSRFQEFLEKFVAAAELLKVGDPEAEDTDVSALIDEASARRIESWVSEAHRNGAQILCGGQRDGAIYRPTVLTGTRSNMKVCRDEVFAPVVVLEAYERFEEAVARVNDSDYGLQAGVFTSDVHKIFYAFEHLHVGGVTVNEVPTFRAEHMPYGGVKDSGLGREGPRFAILDMMEPRVLLFDHRA